MERFSSVPSDVVGIDVGDTATRAVRLRRNKDEISVIEADILPGIRLPDISAESPGEIPPLALAPGLKARYAAVAVSSRSSIVKLLQFPNSHDLQNQEKLSQSMGIKDPDRYRIAAKLINEGHGNMESKVLVAAVPAVQAQAITLLLSSGWPALCSVEVSDLASMTAFLRGPGAQHTENSVGAVDFGSDKTSCAFFSKGVLVLLRRFDFGTNAVLEQLTATLGVDKETAEGIVTDGAFDISHLTSDMVGPLINQLTVSRDFVERRENCHVSVIYVSGGLAMYQDLLNKIKSSTDIEVSPWNPFESLKVGPEALPERLSQQVWQFTAAAGACLATFEK